MDHNKKLEKERGRYNGMIIELNLKQENQRNKQMKGL